MCVGEAGGRPSRQVNSRAKAKAILCSWTVAPPFQQVTRCVSPSLLAAPRFSSPFTTLPSILAKRIGQDICHVFTMSTPPPSKLHQRTTAFTLSLFAVTCLLVPFLPSIVADEVTKEENVWVLTNDNFDSVVSENKYVLVEFCKYS